MNRIAYFATALLFAALAIAVVLVDASPALRMLAITPDIIGGCLAIAAYIVIGIPRGAKTIRINNTGGRSYYIDCPHDTARSMQARERGGDAFYGQV